MQRHILALAATLAAPSLALAQTYRDSSGSIVQGVAPLAGCTAGGSCAGPVSASNPLPVTGSFSATLSGFAPGSAYATPLGVSTTSARVALPAGSVVVVYNTGASAAFVQLGGAAVTATTANDVVAPGGWTAFTVGTNSFLAAVTSSGTTSLNISGGSGLPTGAVGGAGGGGSVPTGAAGTPNAAVVTVQGIAGGTPQPVSLAAGANIIGSVNAAQAGVWSLNNISGVISLPTGAATAANQTAVQSAAGTAQPTAVTIQGNAAGVPVPVAAAQSGTWNIGSITTLPALPAGSNSIGSVTVNAADPCQGAMKSAAAFSGATGQFRIIAGAASKKTYICHISYRVSSAVALSVIEGTGTNCATGAAAMDGSTTAANGKAEAANGGEAAGNGAGDIMHAAVAADDVCLLQSGTATVAGRVTYVQQ